MLPTLLETVATQGCARHRDASRYLQPQPCRCCCLCQPRPLLTMSLQLPLALSCSLFPALPSPGIEAGGCQGEQRVGLGWEGKQSPCTTMELLVRAPPAPVNYHGHTAAFVQGKCHKMQQSKATPSALCLGRWDGKRSTFLAPLQGSLPVPHLQSSQAAPHPSWVCTCEGQALPAIGDVSCLQPVPGLQGEVLVPHQHRGVEAENLPKLGICLCSGHHRAEAGAGLGGRKEDPCSISSLGLPSL